MPTQGNSSALRRHRAARVVSLSLRNGRACVRIAHEEYKRLKARFLELACWRSAETLGAEFRRIRLVPYAPVRKQLLQIWRAVNRARNVAGYDRVPVEFVRWKRSIVKPFEEPELGQAA